MDEVDGMSGGDRGGTTELIQMVKRTKVPIICICNDRQSTKVRALANYCTDMRFRRPTEQQMKARLNTIAFRENFKLEPNAITQLVQSTHNDIRQVINLLSSYMLNKSSMSYMDSKEYTTFNKKEVSIGPFDVIGKYLNKTENMQLSFSDKLDLYYSDFSIVPLFVQENYIDNRPAACENSLEAFDRLSKAADLISESDIVDSKLRGSQQWGLMPLHAALSSVGPAFHVSGGHDGMYRFPGWLGQNSKGTKLSRMLRDVQTHMRLRVSADKTEIRKSYIPAMVPELVSPLANLGAGGISDVVSLMDHYYLTKDHWDAMMELHLDGERMLKGIPSAVKSAFTREYNKTNHPVAFQAVANLSASKAASASASLKPDMEDVIDDDDATIAVNDEGDEEEEEESGDSLDKDALIKVPAKSKTGSASRADSSASSASGSDDPESTIVSVCETEPVLVADETQPLLSDSAIRTRYASNPNEFARSYIDRPQHSSYASPHSLAVSPAALPYSPVENIVIVAPSDMSDSEDSGIDSCASTHSDERDAVQLEAATNEPHTNGPQSVDGSTTVGTLDPSLAQTSVAYSQSANCIDNDDTPSAEQGCLTGSNETAASFTSSKPPKSINQRLAPHTSTVAESEGRSRSSSLNVNARVFVPSARSRTVVDAGREVTAPAAIMPIELSDAQMQALGRSMKSSRALGNSRCSSLSEAKTDVDTDKIDNADSEREPSPAGT
ncbi:DNA replication factor C complex subunit Rfc1, partial [Coemansia furcata]